MSRGPGVPRRKLFLGVGVIALLVVLVAVGLVLGTRGGEAPASPEPGGGATGDAAAVDGGSKCGLESDDTDSLTTAPPTTWSTDTPIAAPSSPEAGPGETTAGVHSCFARTPTGALFAAANVAADLSNPAVRPVEIVDQRVSRDSNFDAMRADTVDNQSQGNERGLQFAAFRLDAYTPDAATVQVVVRSDAAVEGGQLIAVTYNVRWEGGDWMVVVPPTGGPAPGRELVSLAGYVEWGTA